MRQLSEQEIAAVNAFEAEMAGTGLVWDADSESGQKNIQIISKQIGSNPYTLDGLRYAVLLHKDELVWKSAAARSAEAVLNQLSEADRKIIDSWITRQRLVSHDDQGVDNKAILVGWLKEAMPEEGISFVALDKALANILSGTGGIRVRQLHWLPEPPQHEGGYGKHSGKVFSSNNDDKEGFVGGRFNHANSTSPSVRAENSAAAKEAALKAEAEAIRGNTHAKTQQIQRMFVTDRSTGQIDWSATKQARLRLANS
jgi:hypothetical protein